MDSAICGCMDRGMEHSGRVSRRAAHFNGRTLIAPHVYNATCWLGSLLPVLVVVIPSVLSQKAYWRARGFLAAVDVTTLTTQEVAQIWVSVSEAYWYSSLVILLWGVFAMILGIVYSAVIFHVTMHLTRQIDRARRKFEHPETFFFFSPPLQHGHERAMSRNLGGMWHDNGSTEQFDQREEWGARVRSLRHIRLFLALQFFLIEGSVLRFCTASLWSGLTIYEKSRINDVGPTDGVSERADLTVACDAC